MFEKVNPAHPDKVADRIAGALVDLAYTKNDNAKIAVEVLIGHGYCKIIIESSENFMMHDIEPIVYRIAGQQKISIIATKQDVHLAGNQKGSVRCGDNGIFKGMPVTDEQHGLVRIARKLYNEYPTDGKYIINQNEKEKPANLIICQSNAKKDDIRVEFPCAIINPLGDWTGGTNVDTGCTNRKLGSDMGDSVTGGGLHGKDLSKADVSINVYAWLKAQQTGQPQEFFCAIGDEFVDGRPYDEIVGIARDYIKSIGGFEKFAEWGLIA